MAKKKNAQPDASPKSILAGMHRVLKYRGITDKVQVNLSGVRWCWKCRTDVNGKTVCGWEKC